MAETSLDLLSSGQKQVLTYTVLGDRIYEMNCIFKAVGLNALLIVLPYWDNVS